MVELGFLYLFPQNLSFKPCLVSYTMASGSSEMNSSQLCSLQELQTLSTVFIFLRRFNKIKEEKNAEEKQGGEERESC